MLAMLTNENKQNDDIHRNKFTETKCWHKWKQEIIIRVIAPKEVNAKKVIIKIKKTFKSLFFKDNGQGSNLAK